MTRHMDTHCSERGTGQSQCVYVCIGCVRTHVFVFALCLLCAYLCVHACVNVQLWFGCVGSLAVRGCDGFLTERSSARENKPFVLSIVSMANPRGSHQRCVCFHINGLGTMLQHTNYNPVNSTLRMTPSKNNNAAVFDL